MNRGFDVRWRGADGVARKVAFEKTEDGYDRVTYRWTGCAWVVEGREPVTDVAIDGPMPMLETRTGP